MAKLVYGMMQSLDGYVDDVAGSLASMPPPAPALFRHFTAHVAGLNGILYGRVIYGLMRYWEDDHAEWTDDQRAYAAAWRGRHKWVFSRTLKAVGPNATLVTGDVESVVRKLKAELTGEIECAGPTLAGVLTGFGLIDEYRLFFRPFVLGAGKPYFAGARPPLRLVATATIDDAVKATYVPA